MKNFTVAVFIFSSLFAQADSWTQKANFPGLGIDFPFSFSIGNKGYVGCGQTTQEFWEYNPATDTWTQKADFGGTARWVATGFSIGNKGYAGLGTDAAVAIHYQDFWEYDTTANAWTQKATFAGLPRYGAFGFSIGNYGYICAGGIGGTTYNDLWQYDPIADAWTAKATFPGPSREETNGFVIGTNAYMVGGTMDGSTLNVLADLWEYNSITDSWLQKATMPGVARCDAAAFAICDKGYFVTGDPCYCIDIWQYNAANDSWIQKTNFAGVGRDEPAYFAIGTKGYLGLGQSNDFWEYTPDTVYCNLVAAFTAVNHICPGTCTNFTNVSVNATSYQWIFAGATPGTSTDNNPTGICYNTPGNYSVTLIATNSTFSDTLTLNNYVTVYPYPAPQGIAQSGDTLIANQGAVSYQWYHGGVLIPGATDYFYLATSGGDYNVVATDVNHCEVEAAIFDVVAAIQSDISSLGFEVYPNPVGNKLVISSQQYVLNTISIYNLLGEKVYSAADCRLHTVDCRLLPPGLYRLEVSSNDKILRANFVKQ